MRVIDTLDDILDAKSKIRILRRMILYPSEVTTGRRLAQELQMQVSTCNKSLNKLYEAGIVSRKRVGNSYVYEVAKNTKAVKDLLRPLFEKERKIMDSVLSTLFKGLDEKVVTASLFGSTARKEDTLGSDVDILVILKDGTNKKEVEELLSKNEIDAYKEYHTGFNIACFLESDFNKRKDKDPFLKNAIRDSIPLNIGGGLGKER